MVEQNKFKDIPTFNTWKSIEQIHQGFSYDLKYSIKTEDGEKYFLRVSDALSYDRKKQEHEIIGTMTNLGIPSLQEIDFGRCNHGKNVYMLQTWINGNILETALPTLPKDQQYKLGVKAGTILRKMHSFKSTVISDWYSVRLEQYQSNYKKYKQYGIRYKYEHQINEYINENVHLLKGKQVSFVHGDYHVGNMILSPEQTITIIDFDSFDWKAPIEKIFTNFQFLVDK